MEEEDKTKPKEEKKEKELEKLPNNMIDFGEYFKRIATMFEPPVRCSVVLQKHYVKTKEGYDELYTLNLEAAELISIPEQPIEIPKQKRKKKTPTPSYMG